VKSRKTILTTDANKDLWGSMVKFATGCTKVPCGDGSAGFQCLDCSQKKGMSKLEEMITKEKNTLI